MVQRPEQHAAIEALFLPRKVRAFACVVSDHLIADLPTEEAAVAEPMVYARKAEFATARSCARSALAALGVDASIPRRDGGAPLWPVGMAGSISHTRGFCAAVASAEKIAVGLDTEEFGRMKPAIERRILVDAERVDLVDMDSAQRQLRVGTVFAAKEAFYKAHYEIEPRYLGFDAVAVSVRGEKLDFSPASGAVSSEILQQTRGRFLVEDGRVVVGVWIDTAGLTRTLPSDS